MAWSTREIADLAGTSVRAVRHYHEVGLLAEPERRSNGYKLYGVPHLVRLLRIKRLVDLGFSLARIAEMGDMTDHPEQALRTLDAELAATVERLQRIRTELALSLSQATPTDLPPPLAAAAVEVDLSDADRALAVVLTRVLSPATLDAYADMLHSYFTHPAVTEFGRLPADADERIRGECAQRLARLVRQLFGSHPDLRDLTAGAPRGARVATETIGLALNELYTPVQLDVLRRLAELLAAGSGGEY
ncbi:MerR family transcriptional regulator [Nocardia terpenica]|uniref:MerR family transcriptional regulator n=1 Tax=Nocardia terpenica TaxID=455432 RepID=A0A291RQ25_9NOCA|nr:MerR family transcriptional regulator [Nocardia terpenica]ATL69389.1 MerR family transcriptional regulator [Nocardia terpenica]